MPASPDPAAGHPVRLWSRLVFFELEQPRIELDLVTTRGWVAFLGDSLFHQGEPFSLTVAYPGPSWEFPVVAALERWAETGVELKLDIAGSPSRAVLAMSDGESTVIFDLLASTGGLPVRGWGL